MGSMRDRIVWRHHSSRNFPAQARTTDYPARERERRVDKINLSNRNDGIFYFRNTNKFGTVMCNITSQSCDTHINFHLFRDARSFGVRAAFFLWHSGWRRSDAGFPELQSPAEWWFPPGHHS